MDGNIRDVIGAEISDCRLKISGNTVKNVIWYSESRVFEKSG